MLSRLKLSCVAACMAAGVSLAPRPAAAWELSGSKRVLLLTHDGKDIPIGQVVFEPNGAGISYKLTIDESKMTEFFLSMKEFKCLQGTEIECYVPYPYEHPHVVSTTDFSWLEHDLLFFFKAPNDYGAKMQNGLFYNLKPTNDGLIGTPQAIDLDRIASPPADLKMPPYQPADRDDIGAGARWIESLRIE